MYKKLISMTLALAMFLSMGTIANAAGNKIASGENFQSSESNENQNPAPGTGNTNTKNNNAPGTENNVNQNPVPGTGNVNNNSNAKANNAPGTAPSTRHTDTIDNSTPMVEQNKTKNNDMLNTNLPKAAVPSRYSRERVAIAPDISGTKYEEAAEILGALGIMVGDAESGLFRPDDNILRSEMAKVSVYAVGLEDVANGLNTPTRFPDVVSNHWANGAINVAEQQGMVIGDDVGTFRPDDNVLFQEAVTIMVRALGYEPRAAATGSYPTGYMVVASSIQLLKGINATGTEPAKRGDIAQLVFNALTINLMEQTGFGSDASFEVGTKTLLFDRLNVEKGYGQVKGTSETSLTGGSTVSDNHILINDLNFLDSNTAAKQLLGYNVVYYARIDSNSDEKTLIVVRPQDSKNKSLTIGADNISEVTGEQDKNKTITYWETEASNTTKTANIVADPVYILNGKYADNVAIDRLKIERGNLVLLDTDVNNIYDIVFINELTNLVVDTVSTVTGRITDKYNGGSILLDPDNEEIDYSIIHDNYEIELSDLTEWDVLSYTISEDKTLIKAYVSRESILGTVTQKTSDGIKFDTAEGIYEIASSYPNEINIRDKGRFYLDIENKIAAVDETASTDEDNAGRGVYGYLVNAAITGTIDRVLQFKIFTSGGETTVFDGAEKMRVGSTYGQTADEVLAALGKDTITPQLITYETNSSGRITGIDLAADVTDTGAPNVKKFSKNIVADDQIYRSASKKLGNVTVNENTIVFDIPEDAGTDTTKFAVRNASVFSNDTPYDIIVYDLQEDYSAKVIIVTSTTGITNPESPLVIVTETATGQNEDFEEIDIVTGYENGEIVELNSTGKTVFVKDGSTPLEAGDIFQYNTNADGDVDAITLLFDVNDKETEAVNEVTADLTTVYGRAVKKFTNSVNIDVNGEVKNYSTTGATVYSFDSGKKNNKVSVVTPADIEIYEQGNEVRVFLKVYKDAVTEIVIVR